MRNEPPQPPEPQRQPDSPRMEPTYPNQPQQMPYQPYQTYQPAQQSSSRHGSYTVYDDLWLLEDETTRKMSLVVTGIAALLLATVCLVPFLFAAQTADTASHGVATPPTPTTLPPQPLSGATLGGTRDEFTAKLGNPTERSGVPWYTTTLPGDLTIDLCYCSEHTAVDGHLHLVSFHFDAPEGVQWSEREGMDFARLFFPPDAKRVREFTDPRLGIVHVFVSADLAATFPASEFTASSNGQSLPPGTFSVACSQPGYTSQCLFVTGSE